MSLFVGDIDGTHDSAVCRIGSGRNPNRDTEIGRTIVIDLQHDRLYGLGLAKLDFALIGIVHFTPPFEIWTVLA